MAASSFQRIKYAAKAECQVQKKLRIIFMIFLATAVVFMIFSSTRFDDEYSNMYVELPVFGGMLYIAAMFCGIVLCVNAFKDCHHVQTADVLLSMPVSTSERYWSKLLAIAYIQIIPTLISAVVVFIGLGFYADFSTSAVLQLLSMIGLYISFVLFTNAITIFCTCCCGTIAESFYVTIIMLGCISLTPYLFYSSQILENSGTYSGGGKFFGFWSYSLLLNFDENATLLSNMSIFISCALSIALVLLTKLIYSRRDARSVGKPIVFKAFFEAFVAIGLVTLFTLFATGNMFYVGLILSFVIYIVIRVILVRGKIRPLNVLNWLIKYASVFAVFIALCAASYYTGGFGYYRYVPSDDFLEKSSVRCSVSNYADDYSDTKLFTNSTISAEKAKEVVDIYIRYKSNEPKDFEGFKRAIGIDKYSYDEECSADIAIYPENRQPGLLSETSYFLNISLSPDMADELLNELEGISYLYDDYE